MSSILGDLGEAVVLIRSDNSKLLEELRALRAHAEKAGDESGHALETAWGVGLEHMVEKSLEAFKEIGEGLKEIVEKGGRVADIRENFNELAKSIGESPVAAIDALRRGTRGLVEDGDLMVEMNKIMSSGLHLTSQQMYDVASAAFLLAKRTGKELPDAFQIVGTALTTGRAKMLAHEGVMVELKGATDDVKKSMASMGDEMDTADTLAARQGATLEALTRFSKAAAGQGLNLEEQVGQVNIQVANFVTELGESISTSTVLNKGLSDLTKSFNELVPDARVKVIALVRDLFEDMAIGANLVGIAFTYITENETRAFDAMHAGFVLGEMGAKSLELALAELGVDITGLIEKWVQYGQVALAVLKATGQAPAMIADPLNAALTTAQGFLEGLGKEEQAHVADLKVQQAELAKTAIAALSGAAGYGEFYDKLRDVRGAMADAVVDMTMERAKREAGIVTIKKEAEAYDDLAARLRKYYADLAKMMSGDAQEKALKSLLQIGNIGSQVERYDKALINNMKIRERMEDEGALAHIRATGTQWEYDTLQINLWMKHQKEALDANADNYDEAAAAIEAAGKEKFAVLERDWKDTLDEMNRNSKQFVSLWDALTDQMSGDLAQAFQGSMLGGGGGGNAWKNFGQQMLGHVSQGITGQLISKTVIGTGMGKIVGSVAAHFGVHAAGFAASALTGAATMGISIAAQYLGTAIYHHMQNQTKKVRDQFAKDQGFKDLGGLYDELMKNGPEGQKLADIGSKIIGKHDEAANRKWMDDVLKFLDDVKKKQDALSDPLTIGDRRLIAQLGLDPRITTHNDLRTLSVPHMDAGGVANWGSAGQLAMLHNNEAVFPLDTLQGMMREAVNPMSATELVQAMKSAGFGAPNIHFAPEFNGLNDTELMNYAKSLLPSLIRVMQDNGNLRSQFFSLQGA